MRTNAREDGVFAAAFASIRPEWQGFGQYCEWLEKGVRTRAFAELEAFLSDASAWPFDMRLEFVLWVLKLERDPANNPLLSHQLRIKLLVPTIRELNTRAPDRAESYLWLGLLRQDNPSAHLAHAVEIDPTCEPAHQMLSQWICCDISYNQHELPAFYIHDPRIDLEDLDRVVALCTPYIKQRWAVSWRREAARQRKRVHAWLKAHPRPGDFAAQ